MYKGWICWKRAKKVLDQLLGGQSTLMVVKLHNPLGILTWRFNHLSYHQCLINTMSVLCYLLYTWFLYEWWLRIRIFDCWTIRPHTLVHLKKIKTYLDVFLKRLSKVNVSTSQQVLHTSFKHENLVFCFFGEFFLLFT